MSSSPQTVIRLERVSKKYPIYDSPSRKLLEMLTLRRKSFHREFWALQDIDLTVEQGTTLGIVGQNGSGKSTLLQIVAGILRQSRGDCFIEGSVAALLELGAGFNPEFTGRENVFMNGAISGLSRETMEARLDDILDFAEIGQFIDQPVKTFSSGMFVRLAFAVAIHVDPDILLVDEALAVGDMVFQHRCINRIRQLEREGKTILFVTHDLQALAQFCDRAILLDRGRKLLDASPEEVVQAYHALVFERERTREGQPEARVNVDEEEGLPIVRTIPYIHNRYGEGGAEIIGILLRSPEGRVVTDLRAGEELHLLVSVHFKKPTRNPIVGVTIRDRMGQEICATNSSFEGVDLPDARPGETMTVGFRWTVPPLRPGSYSISPAAARGTIWEHRIDDWIDNAYIVNVVETGLVYGMMKIPFAVRFRRFGV
jgi:lipopolysaccharide transport system ATP-binding protein